MLRGLVALLVGPVLGQTTPSLPLYLGEALAVEAAGARARTPAARARRGGRARCGPARVRVGVGLDPGRHAAAVGAGDCCPRRSSGAAAAGTAGGVARGADRHRPARRAAAGRPWRGRPVRRGGRARSWSWPTAFTSRRRRPCARLMSPGGRGRRDAPSGSSRPARQRDAAWLQVTAWQGGGLVVDRLEPAGGGWRTTRPIPLDGGVEGHAAPAARPGRARRTGPPARGSGDPRRRGPRRRRHRAAARARPDAAAARAQGRRPRHGSGAARRRWSWCSRWASWARSPGASAACARTRPAAARLRYMCESYNAERVRRPRADGRRPDAGGRRQGGRPRGLGTRRARRAGRPRGRRDDRLLARTSGSRTPGRSGWSIAWRRPARRAPDRARRAGASPSLYTGGPAARTAGRDAREAALEQVLASLSPARREQLESLLSAMFVRARDAGRRAPRLPAVRRRRMRPSARDLSGAAAV